MKLSVIIPTFERSEILKFTLDALTKQNLPKKDFEVIVVDDGSNDNGATKKVVESVAKKTMGTKRQTDEFKIIYTRQKNQKQGIARNNGVKKAKGEVILFLGDDIIPADKNFLSEHLKLHKKNPDETYGVLGFTDWHPDIEVNYFMKWLTHGSCVLGRYGGHQFAYEKLGGGPDGKDSFGNAVPERITGGKNFHKKFADYSFFYTSNISLKRSLLMKEPFDKNFGAYGWEDIELGYRLQKKYDFKLMYNPNAIGWHHHVITEKSLSPRMRMIAKSAKIIDEKYPELHIRPSKLKIFIFKILGNHLTLQLLKSFGKINRKWMNYYYYGLSKKYYLEGL